MATPFQIPMRTQFSQAPLIGSVLIGILVSAGWLMTDPDWSQSKTGDGIFNSGQSWITMAVVFVIAAIIGFYGVKWWTQ